MENARLAPSPFRMTVRLASVLGLSALTFTRELNPIHLMLAWTALGLSLFLDRQDTWQRALRRFETLAVILLVSLTGFDFFRWGSTLFVAVAHFLVLFLFIKLVG